METSEKQEENNEEISTVWRNAIVWSVKSVNRVRRGTRIARHQPAGLSSPLWGGACAWE